MVVTGHLATGMLQHHTDKGSHTNNASIVNGRHTGTKNAPTSLGTKNAPTSLAGGR